MSQIVTLSPRGGYALRESQKFLCGFTPASGGVRARGTALENAFLLDGSYEPVAVRVTQPEGRGVEVQVFGTREVDRAVGQIARVLGLDVDGTLLDEVAARDAVVAGLLAQRPGFRPVCFASPYEAAVWGVLAQRIPMRVAANFKRALAEQHGARVECGGEVFHTLPSPERLLRVASLPGVPEEKLRRLHAVAVAARDGRLDVDRLRSLPEGRALEELRSIRGVGEWTAQHVLYRGAGLPDAVATAEPRVLRAARLYYGAGRAEFGADDLERTAEAWRPVRMWVSILLVSSIADRPEWHGPEVRGKRRIPSRVNA